MVSWPGRAIYALGFLLLIHSGYSAYEHLAYVKIIGKHEESLPIDIILECIISVILCSVGLSLVAGEFKPISLEKQLTQMSVDAIDSRPSFRTLNHRGTTVFRAST
ncbi:magnesium transporter [Fimicolochytrium jonesii]|uniref:magnesium transporter n=1 Tax=Fimicolochytrium jonesii TaxID=1396493 RepID=UPI0022FE8110|nr:magnesium transporter [Fimicolochytrium jonesii]KAI8816062.1 magnesium transporter [Fimicolochytrium jonesii]